MSGHVLSTTFAEVGLLRPTPGIGICQPKRRALTLVDLLTTVIAYEYSFTSHETLLLHEKNAIIVPEYAAKGNTPSSNV
jgi:hypothetical protein